MKRSGMDPGIPTDSITLWRSDAIVLFDWLMSVDLNTVPVTHPAQKQALSDLCSRLEVDTLAMHCTEDQIKQAQADVARDMDW
jgi:cytochrome c-type biogenesis protein CcmH/NrfF